MTAPSAEWLAGQRWFAGAAPAEDPPMVSTVVDGGLTISIATVGARHYQLLTVDDRPDAFDDPAVGAALADAFARGRIASGAAGTITFASAGARDTPGGPTRALGAEQSNSSLVLGEQAILKVLRRLEPGVHPEIEMLEVLTDRGSRHVPALRGWYRVEGGPVDAVLGVLVDFVPDGRDGWDLILERLARDPGSTMPLLHDLGAALAEIHGALGSGPGHPDFAPGDGGKALAATLARSVSEAAQALADRLAEQPGTKRLRADLREAADRAPRLADRLDAGPVIRHHGDLHLGQTLHTPRGWVVIDWEGEPARSLAERRAKGSPLRDVAGMLRSFSYAAATDRVRAGGATTAGWEPAARAAFLDGYLADADPELLPPTTIATARLLALLELEKVVYEIGYEADHRPDWLPIPATGLHSLLHRTGLHRTGLDRTGLDRRRR